MARKAIYTKELGSRIATAAKPRISKKYHVITGDAQKWTVVADGNIRATRVFATKINAIQFAKDTAGRIAGEVIIHKKSGEIEERLSLAK